MITGCKIDSVSGNRESGAALLVFMVVIVLLVSTYIVRSINMTDDRIAMETTTSRALKQAKQALISYAVFNHDNASAAGNPNAGLFGFLPCPDTGGVEGQPNSPCNAQYTSALGRLPWGELGIEPIKDGAGKCLWYAVSSEYKDSGPDDRNDLDNPAGLSRSEMLNQDSNGTFILNDVNGNPLIGANADNRLVAVVIAPGPALPGQNGTHAAGTLCGMNNSAADFLEGGNETLNGAVDAIDTFTTANSVFDTNINDRAVGITQQDIFDAITQRADFQALMENTTRTLADCIASYGQTNDAVMGGSNSHFHLPWPASMDPGEYRDSRAYIETDTAGTNFGRLPVDVLVSDGYIGNGATHYLLEKAIPDCDNFQTGALAGPGGNYNSAERRFWQNWKDHFFYAVSGDFASSAGLPVTPADGACTNCIIVSGEDYAAIVIYSGSRLAGQIRTVDPIDADTKLNLTNYLEGSNAGNYPDSSGNGVYMNPAVPMNDIAFCIQEDMSVVQCP
jgi:hypothetical protein